MPPSWKNEVGGKLRWTATHQTKLLAGELFLCTKTPERAHLPSRLWQSVKLQRSYEVALQQITDELEHWSGPLVAYCCIVFPRTCDSVWHGRCCRHRPKYFVHKNKQRLTKLTQYLIRRKKETTRERYPYTKHKQTSIFAVTEKLPRSCRKNIITSPARQGQRERRREAKVFLLLLLDHQFLLKPNSNRS